MENQPVTKDVIAGIIIRNGLVLACQRSYGEGVAGLWEFPGGKQKPHETAEACLQRECREELLIDIDIIKKLISFPWPHPANPTFAFTFYLATIRQGEPVCLEHRALRWVAPQALDSLPFCPADASILEVVRRAILASSPL